MCPGKNVTGHGFKSIYVSSKASTGNYQTEYAVIDMPEKCSDFSVHIKINYQCEINAVYEEIEPGLFWIFYINLLLTVLLKISVKQMHRIKKKALKKAEI